MLKITGKPLSYFNFSSHWDVARNFKGGEGEDVNCKNHQKSVVNFGHYAMFDFFY